MFIKNILTLDFRCVYSIIRTYGESCIKFSNIFEMSNKLYPYITKTHSKMSNIYEQFKKRQSILLSLVSSNINIRWKLQVSTIIFYENVINKIRENRSHYYIIILVFPSFFPDFSILLRKLVGKSINSLLSVPTRQNVLLDTNLVVYNQIFGQKVIFRYEKFNLNTL